jgi:aldehyde dehydrogenase (NAD+)
MGPFATMALKTAPALATGNVMIIKPSEKSPFASLRSAVLAEEAGLPDGVLLCLPGVGFAGSGWSSHTKAHKVSFTGSVATGRDPEGSSRQ